MKITIICTDVLHPVYDYLSKWAEANIDKYDINLLTSISEIKDAGDILFLISCSEIVRQKTRELFKYTLVLHASDLPNGRGWSPHIWDILNGSEHLTLSLLNADDSVDTGDVWQQKLIPLNGCELYDEINDKLFTAELELMSWACENIDSSKPHKQRNNIESTYHRKRTSKDSEINIDVSIRSQFNLLRVCDPNRFPAYFYINGCKYNIRLEKVNER